MISSGRKTAFWEWLTGGGFYHAWTGSDPTDIAMKLHSTLVDVVLFDHTHPGSRHPVWSTDHVMVVVWYTGPSTHLVPDGWKQRYVFFLHLVLGGVTNGTFRVWVGVWSTIGDIHPRAQVGVSSNLRQIIDPTIGGHAFTKGEPPAGSLNTSEGLLAWTR